MRFITRLTAAWCESPEEQKVSLKSKSRRSWQLQSNELIGCLIIYLIFMSTLFGVLWILSRNEGSTPLISATSVKRVGIWTPTNSDGSGKRKVPTNRCNQCFKVDIKCLFKTIFCMFCRLLSKSFSKSGSTHLHFWPRPSRVQINLHIIKLLPRSAIVLQTKYKSCSIIFDPLWAIMCKSKSNIFPFPLISDQIFSPCASQPLWLCWISGCLSEEWGV